MAYTITTYSNVHTGGREFCLTCQNGNMFFGVTCWEAIDSFLAYYG